MTPRVQSWIQEVGNGEINYLELLVFPIYKPRLIIRSQVGLDQIWLVNLSSVQLIFGQVRLCQVQSLVRFHQVRSGQVRLGQVSQCQLNLVCFMLCQIRVRLGLLIFVQFRIVNFSLVQFISVYVRLVNFRLGQIMIGQLILVCFRLGQIRIVDFNEFRLGQFRLGLGYGIFALQEYDWTHCTHDLIKDLVYFNGPTQ